MEGFREGEPRYFAMVAPRRFGMLPGIEGYVECSSNQQGPILLEDITVQSYVHQSFERCGKEFKSVGTLWSRDKILLKLTEELGELVQALRKGSREEQLHEYGDLLFAMFALAEREEIGVNDELCKAVVQFEKFCNELAKDDQKRVLELSPLHDDFPGSYGEVERLADKRWFGKEQRLTEKPVEKQAYLVTREPLSDSYDRYCENDCGKAIHRSNVSGYCPDCAAAVRSRVGVK